MTRDVSWRVAPAEPPANRGGLRYEPVWCWADNDLISECLDLSQSDYCPQSAFLDTVSPSESCSPSV